MNSIHSLAVFFLLLGSVHTYAMDTGSPISKKRNLLVAELTDSKHMQKEPNLPTAIDINALGIQIEEQVKEETYLSFLFDMIAINRRFPVSANKFDSLLLEDIKAMFQENGLMLNTVTANIYPSDIIARLKKNHIAQLPGLAGLDKIQPLCRCTEDSIMLHIEKSIKNLDLPDDIKKRFKHEMLASNDPEYFRRFAEHAAYRFYLTHKPEIFLQ